VVRAVVVVLKKHFLRWVQYGIQQRQPVTLTYVRVTLAGASVSRQRHASVRAFLQGIAVEVQVARMHERGAG
jgi:hypothetical protein